MGWAVLAAPVLSGLLLAPLQAPARPAAAPGDPMRIAILVDNSQNASEPLPQIRRALYQFVEALPPDHELMLVTTGGQMNIRVQPTRDYLEIQEAAGEIFFSRGGGNALLGAVQEVYDRYLRTAERRWPVFVILTTDGPDSSQRVTEKTFNQLLQGLASRQVMVNATLLTSTGTSLVRSLTLTMIEQTGGAYESATIGTALPGKMKSLATRIGQQYRQQSSR